MDIVDLILAFLLLLGLIGEIVQKRVILGATLLLVRVTLLIAGGRVWGVGNGLNTV